MAARPASPRVLLLLCGVYAGASRRLPTADFEDLLQGLDCRGAMGRALHGAAHG